MAPEEVEELERETTFVIIPFEEADVVQDINDYYGNGDDGGADRDDSDKGGFNADVVQEVGDHYEELGEDTPPPKDDDDYENESEGGFNADLVQEVNDYYEDGIDSDDKEDEKENSFDFNYEAILREDEDAPADGVLDCSAAYDLDLGELIDVEDATSGISHVVDCAGSGDFKVDLIGSWYKVVGNGLYLRASSCPALLSVYEGVCDDLVCASVDYDDLGCQAEWTSIRDRNYYVLVQSISDLATNEDGEESALWSVELVVDEAEAPSQDGNEQVVISEDERPNKDDGDDMIIKSCKNEAKALEVNDIIASSFQFPLGDFSPCEISIPQRMRDDLRGAWFTVVGSGGPLRASACPYQLSVYTGSCDDLECAEGFYTDESQCEFQWETPTSRKRRGVISYILVQSTLAGVATDSGGTFELAVTDLIPSPVELTTDPQETKPSDQPVPTETEPPTAVPETLTPTFAPIEPDTPAPTFEDTPPPTDTPVTTAPEPTPDAPSPTSKPIDETSVDETTSKPTQKPSEVITAKPTPEPIEPDTPAPTFELPDQQTNNPTTPSPTPRPIATEDPSPPTTSSTPAPTFEDSDRPVIEPPTIPEKPDTPRPTTILPGTSAPTVESEMSVAPTDDDQDDVLVQQCQKESIPLEAEDEITTDFLFPLSEEYAPCELQISPTKRNPIRATWLTVAGNGTVLEANACPYQITVYIGGCDSLECADGVYTDSSGCSFAWDAPEDDRLSYILVQSTIIGFPDSGDLSFTLSIDEADSPLIPPINDTVAPSATESESETLAPTEAPDLIEQHKSRQLQSMRHS